jgi:hypothetical protein
MNMIVGSEVSTANYIVFIPIATVAEQVRKYNYKLCVYSYVVKIETMMSV